MKQSQRGRRGGYLFKALAIAAGSLILSRPSAGQDLSVKASVNESTIGTEETVTYTIEVAGRSLPDMPSPEPPETRGLVLANQFPFTSQNMSIVNGRVEQSIAYTWTFRPVREGEAVFRAGELSIEGKTFATREIKITVVPQSLRPRRPQRRSPFLLDPFGNQQKPGEQEEITERDMFIRAVPTKRTAYQNEQITIEYSLYFRSGIQLRQSRLADSWDAEGFWREELDIESRPVPTNVVVDGLRYNMITLKRVTVFPTHTGRLRIDPLKIESEASLPFGSGDPFFSLRNRYQPIRLSSPAVTIEVLPLPPDAPTSFSGVVGKLDMVASADRNALDVGESLQVKLTISGTGNIRTIDPPVFRVPGVFETYDPEIGVRIDRSGRSVRGSKTFTYVLVPRANGQYEIPPFEFSYFDPSTERYVTERSKSIPVTVSGTAGPLAEVSADPAGLPLDDIAPIQDTGVRWRRTGNRSPHTNPAPYLVLALPLLALVGVKLWKAHADRLATDLQYARSRRAHPLARRHLKTAEQFLDANDAASFYEELERAVLGFIGNRLNISELGLTREQLVNRLLAEGIIPNTCAALTDLLEECDRGRFAPVRHDRPVLEAARNRALDLIVRLDAAFNQVRVSV